MRWIYGVYAAAAFVVVVLILFCPVLIVAPTLRLRRAIGRLTVRSWLAVIGVRLRSRGLEHLPQEPCIALCNHASYVDGIVFTAALPTRFTFLVQHRAADWPYIGLILRRMGVIFINRTDPWLAGLGIRKLIRAVQRGESIAIFPEGHFRPQPGLMPFFEGAFKVAAKAGVPVVPGVIRGTRVFFAEGQGLPRWTPIEIELFALIRAAAGPTREQSVRLRDDSSNIMAQHCGEFAAMDLRRVTRRAEPHGVPLQMAQADEAR